MQRERSDSTGKTENEQDIEHIAAQGVADGYAAVALARCHHTRGKLGKRRAHSHHGKSHNGIADTKLSGYSRGTAHEEVGAAYQTAQTDDDKQTGTQPRHGCLGLGSLVGGSLRRFVGGILLVSLLGRQSCLQRDIHEKTEQCQQHQRVDARKRAVETHQHQQHRGHEGEGNVLAHGLAQYGHWCHESRHADYQQRIEHVAAHHIAHGKVGSALESGYKADAELGHRGAHSHYRQADNYLRDVETGGYAHCSVGKAVGSPQHENHAYYDINNL